MKKTFMESFIKTAVKEKDFLPLSDEEGNITIHSTTNVLVKESFGSLIVLELIDADALTSEEIRIKLEENSMKLANLKAKSNFIFELFVFEAEQNQEKIDIITSSQVHNAMGKRFLKCMSLSLNSQKLEKHFKVPMTDCGIEKIVNTVFKADHMSGVSIEEIKDIIKQKSKEYEIEFKAKTPIFTYALIAVNALVLVLIYLYSFKSGSDYSKLLIDFGAKENLKILSGEYWRFITPIFLHANIVHLLVNCYSLYIIGVTVEKIFGHMKFLFVYMVAGILGNIASFMFSTNPGVGASGAIFGLMGALLYFGLDRPSLFKKYFGTSVITTIIINLAYGFSNSGIDNFAHIGGLIGGFFSTGIIMTKSRQKWYLNSYLALILTLVIACTGLSYGFYNKQNTDLLKFNEKFSELKQFDKDKKWNEVEKVAKEILAMKYKDDIVNSEVLWSLVKAEASFGKYIEGEEYAKELIKIDPPNGHYLLGILYLETNQFDKAKEEITQAKKLKAGYENIDELLGNLDKITKGKN